MNSAEAPPSPRLADAGWITSPRTNENEMKELEGLRKAVSSSAPDVVLVADEDPVATAAAKHEQVTAEQLKAKASSKYVKVKLIGSGSFGEAWLCKERGSVKPPATEMVVAKIMNLPGMGMRDLQNAQCEVGCMAAIDHVNVVRMHESQVCGDELVLILEFADAGDLRRHIKIRNHERQFLSESEVMLLFLQILIAMEHIHSNSMLHRDLKTANILITSAGMAKIADFGFSKQFEDTVSSAVAKTVCGTPYYMAPEMWKNSRYSSRAEVWSLGVILYELFALERPFVSENIKELMGEVCAGRYKPLPKKYSPEACALVAALLNLDAAKRPTALEVLKYPFVEHYLASLQDAITGNIHITDVQKEKWRVQMAALCAKLAKLPERTLPLEQSVSDLDKAVSSPHFPGKLRKDIAFDGPVKKLGTGADMQWSNRYLYLREGWLHLCDAKGVVEGRRSLSVDTLASVSILAPNVGAHKPNCFVISTKTSKSTVLQAEDAEKQGLWVRRILQSMGVLA